jgi:hypothetical protein
MPRGANKEAEAVPDVVEIFLVGEADSVIRADGVEKGAIPTYFCDSREVFK